MRTQWIQTLNEDTILYGIKSHSDSLALVNRLKARIARRDGRSKLRLTGQTADAVTRPAHASTSAAGEAVTSDRAQMWIH